MKYVENQIGKQIFYTADYAQFCEDELRIRKTPYKGWNGYSLENVKYSIREGTLLISATAVEWGAVNNPISTWYNSLLDVHEVCQEWLDEHEVPEKYIKRNFKKRVWFFFHVNYKIVLDLRGEDISTFKKKNTSKFEYAINPFKIKE